MPLHINNDWKLISRIIAPLISQPSPLFDNSAKMPLVLGGNFYALDAATGRKLWGQRIGGAIGGGVITYTMNGTQKVAVTTAT